MKTTNDYGLTDQQKRFCDEYLVSFNAFNAALEAGYSENTARKGELLHVHKVQLYLKAAMKRTSERLEITHDLILRELAKIAFSNMGDYFDYRGDHIRMCELSADQKAAISQYEILDVIDDEGHRIGKLNKIKLHNKMSALDKIARHLGFFNQSQESRGRNQDFLKPGVVLEAEGAGGENKEVRIRNQEGVETGDAEATDYAVDKLVGADFMCDNTNKEQAVDKLVRVAEEKQEARIRNQDGVNVRGAGDENTGKILTFSPLVEREGESLKQEALSFGPGFCVRDSSGKPGMSFYQRMRTSNG
jgi:phage terminase small subunit